MSEVRLSDFKATHIVGTGTFGKVYKAVLNNDATKFYAVKSISLLGLSNRTKFNAHMRELTVPFEVQSPFMQDLLYSFMTNDRIYLIMPFMSSGNLYERMQKAGGRFDENTVRFFLTQVVLGIKTLHDKDFAHRDIKPENVMLCQNGYVKLIDFGWSKALEVGEFTMTKEAGTILF